MRDIISTRLAVMLGAIVLACMSCQHYQRSFHVQHEGAIMPVKIRGAQVSHTYLILLPGGPSGDGLIYSTLFPVFKQNLEPRYRMVYYDQRGAGNCQGVYDTSSLTMKELGEDLDQIVRTIRHIDPLANIYLLGYSFGGALGIRYLQKPEHQQRIAGFISIAGAVDRQAQRANQQKLVAYLLDHWVETGAIDNYDALQEGYHCREAADIADCRQDSIETVQLVQKKITALDQYNRLTLTGGTISRLLKYAFLSAGNPLQSGLAEGQHGKYYQREFDTLTLSKQMTVITTPTLFIHGRYDTNIPFFEAETAYLMIGTPMDQKRLVILEHSGHLPMITEPDRLSASIIDFIGE